MFNVLRAEASEVRSTPFGPVGTLYAGSDIEVVWVSKQDEEIDPGWFVSDQVDVLAVVQGQLRVEFEADSGEDGILGPGDVLVLPPLCACRAYRWPRDAEEATVFLAAYPSGATAPAGRDGER